MRYLTSYKQPLSTFLYLLTYFFLWLILEISIKEHRCKFKIDRLTCSKYSIENVFIWEKNKHTLTGPANCKETTRHHAHLSLCAKSRKTNDAKLRKWPKTSIWTIFWRFRGESKASLNIHYNKLCLQFTLQLTEGPTV